MDIKMIAMDLDGTLLKSNKEISERTIETLQRAAAREIHIVLATGRTAWGIQSLLRRLGCVRYAVMANGAIIEDLQLNVVIDEHFLSAKRAVEIYDYVKPMDVMFDFFADGMGYTENAFFEYVKRIHIDEATRQLLIDSRQSIPSVRNYLLQSGGVEKVTLLFADVSKRKFLWEKLLEEASYTVTSSMAANLEINDREATKANGLKSLCHYLGISLDNVLAFGDSKNDIEMLRVAGIGVAMGNAQKEVKAAADVIALSNDEDGVADMVERKLRVI